MLDLAPTCGGLGSWHGRLAGHLLMVITRRVLLLLGLRWHTRVGVGTGASCHATAGLEGLALLAGCWFGGL